MSDRIAVLSAGKVEQIGTVNEIYYQPATRFVATFIGETNIVEAEVLSVADGLIHCRLEGGLELDVKLGPKPPERSILLSLRPEKLRLFHEKPEGRNVFPGKIAVEIFKGAIDDLTVNVQGGLIWVPASPITATSKAIFTREKASSAVLLPRISISSPLEPQRDR